MALVARNDLRNVAIVAHVDHGKTTLVDAMLKQTNSFDAHFEGEDRMMDSNDPSARRASRSSRRTPRCSTTGSTRTARPSSST